MKLRVGILGMADNVTTRLLIQDLNDLGRHLDAAFLLQPKARVQARRVIHKLRSAGFRATLRRILQALGGSAAGRSVSDGSRTDSYPPVVHFVNDVNGAECRRLMAEQDLDLVVLSVDVIVARGTFSIPRLGCLNGHPGWNPAYRGLGATLAMLKDGLRPAVTIHFIDEGIDTGPVLLREEVSLITATGKPDGERALIRESAALFDKAIRLIESGDPPIADTFLEPSNMTRGFSAREARRICTRAAGRSLASIRAAVCPSSGAAAGRTFETRHDHQENGPT